MRNHASQPSLSRSPKVSLANTLIFDFVTDLQLRPPRGAVHHHCRRTSVNNRTRNHSAVNRRNSILQRTASSPLTKHTSSEVGVVPMMVRRAEVRALLGRMVHHPLVSRFQGRGVTASRLESGCTPVKYNQNMFYVAPPRFSSTRLSLV